MEEEEDQDLKLGKLRFGLRHSFLVMLKDQRKLMVIKSSKVHFLGVTALEQMIEDSAVTLEPAPECILK